MFFTTQSVDNEYEITYQYYNEYTPYLMNTTCMWTTCDIGYLKWNEDPLYNIKMIKGITQYYRLTFSLLSAIKYTDIYVDISVCGGFILYMNGYEVSRQNLPENVNITSDTYAIDNKHHSYEQEMSSGIHTILVVDPTYRYQSYRLHFYIPILHVNIQSLNNILAIEVHKYQDDIRSYNTFKSMLHLTQESTNLIQNGYGSVEGDEDNPDANNLFDGNRSTYYESETCENVKIYYTYYNEMKVFITRYALQITATCNNYHPSSWILEGSNSYDDEFSIIHKVTNRTFNIPSEYLLYNVLPYTSYSIFRLRILDCNNKLFSTDVASECSGSHFRLSGIFFLSGSGTNLCEDPEGIWSTTTRGGYAFRKCTGSLIGYEARNCLNDGILSDTIISYCHPAPPKTLEYSNSVFYYAVDDPLQPIVPTETFVNMTFSLITSLPLGFKLDYKTGIITGYVIQGSMQTKTQIEVSNAYGSNIATLYFVITGVRSHNFCFPDSEWDTTPIYTKTSLPCSAGYSGYKTRYCNYTTKAEWEDPISYCVAIPGYISVKYTQTEYVFGINTNIYIVPVITGSVDSWNISPLLPSCLSFVNGIIAGNCSNEFDEKYIITAVGLSIATSEISITIIQKYCTRDSMWPNTSMGSQIIRECPNANQQGSLTRFCKQSSTGEPEWSVIYDDCHFSSPLFYYPLASMIVYVNDAILIQPYCNGQCDYYTVDNTLPKGLEMNRTTGVIKGIVKEIIDIDYYTVTVHNNDSISTCILEFSVLSAVCLQERNWLTTLKGETAKQPCTDSYQEGYITRDCGNTVPPRWLEPVEYCFDKAPNVTYPDLLVFSKNMNISRYTPIIENHVTLINIIPDLPLGLYYDNQTGTIYGTPLTSTSTKLFFMAYAYNTDKYSSSGFLLQINVMYCEQEHEWNTTEYTTIAYQLCINTDVQYRTRQCLYNSESKEFYWSTINDDNCYLPKLDLYMIQKNYIAITIPIQIDSLDYLLSGLQLYRLKYIFYTYFSDYKLSDTSLYIYDFYATYTNRMFIYTLAFIVPENRVNPLLISLIEFINTKLYSYMVLYDPTLVNMSILSSADNCVIYHATNYNTYLIILISVISILLLAILGYLIYYIRKKFHSYQIRIKRRASSQIVEDEKNQRIPMVFKSTARGQCIEMS